MTSFSKDVDQKPPNTTGSRAAGNKISYTKEVGKC
jgi:hypothetical protein